MNPYKPPESAIEIKVTEAPKSIRLVYLMMALSFLFFLMEELVYAALSEGGLLDIYNYFFIPIWSGILFWLYSLIRDQKKNEKSTFLLLAVIVSGMSIYDPVSDYSLYFALFESACFLAIYFLLRRKDALEWFGNT